MVQLFGTGFEMGSLNVMDTLVKSPTLQTDVKRTGVYAVQATGTAGAGGYVQVPETNALWLGVGIYPTAEAGTGLGSVANVIGVKMASGVLVCGLGFAPGSTTLMVYLRQSGAYDYSVIGYGPTLELNKWYYVELGVSATTVGEWTTFSAKAYVDGVLVVDDGDATAFVDAGKWLYAGWGKLSSVTFDAAQRGVVGYYDDFKVNDTTGTYNAGRVGRGGFHWLPVVGVGASSQFTPSDGEADNYEMVDEVPADEDTSYVSTTTEGMIDTYEIEVPEGVTGAVSSAVWWALPKIIEAGGGNIAPVLRIGGANYVADQKGVDTTYRYVRHVYDINPATGQPWTLPEVAAIEIGQKSIS